MLISDHHHEYQSAKDERQHFLLCMKFKGPRRNSYLVVIGKSQLIACRMLDIYCCTLGVYQDFDEFVGA